ncbi:MAG: alcohol dehydrogenase catalytic domain-containing protein [Microvirga sp.]|nr:alcohol dehydrogenase catalytic domain-containing protein [Microvirga sp.]
MEDRPKPAAKDGEVLIRIHATTASSGDMRVRSLKLLRGLRLIGHLVIGITRPRQPICGTELLGTIEAADSDVTAWKVGHAVIALPGDTMRCHADYRVVAAGGPIAPKPGNLDVGATGGTTSLRGSAELPAVEPPF